MLKPDVLTLDIAMPKMDGLTFLKNLMREYPMPVVMFSSLSDAGADVTLACLEAGAVDFMPKYSTRMSVDREEYHLELVSKVKSAASVQVVKPSPAKAMAPLPELNDCRVKMSAGLPFSSSINRLIAIGTSTGGPEALREVLSHLPTHGCALVICQHMPEYFIQSFAKRLNDVSEFDIKVAQHGDIVQPGCGYIAPGDQHLELDKIGGKWVWQVLNSEKVSGHRPSVNVLFDSLAKLAPKSTIAVLMTGMGEDGAVGLKALRTGGALTFIQDLQSSVVWGMPGKADALDAQDKTLTLQEIGPVIEELARL